jgi:hypothetical protein
MDTSLVSIPCNVERCRNPRAIASVLGDRAAGSRLDEFHLALPTAETAAVGTVV